MATIGKALIVGGGIAGLTAATALAQRGIDCDVVETSSETLGAAIMISDRALDALDSLGVGQEFRANGIANPLVPVGPLPTYGMPRQSVGQYRPVFSDLLRRRAEAAGAKVRKGIGLKALSQDGAGVDVTLTDNSVARYDLVIGADGIRSTTRGLVVGEDLQPLYAGQSNIRWMTPGPPIDLPGGVFPAPFGKFLSYPLPRQNLIYAITVFTGEPGYRPTDHTTRKLLREQLEAMNDPYADALLARLTDDLELLYRPFEWLMVPDPWYRGRVVLIGDAAHATTAHMSSGGGMAIEDAVALAEELADCDSIAAAFEAFMRRRLERVRLVVDTSVRLSRMEAEGADWKTMFDVGAPTYEALQYAY